MHEGLNWVHHYSIKIEEDNVKLIRTVHQVEVH
jgi:hypothetical protein